MRFILIPVFRICIYYIDTRGTDDLEAIILLSDKINIKKLNKLTEDLQEEIEFDKDMVRKGFFKSVRKGC